MQTRVLGKTGVKLSAIGLGAMPLSVPDNRPSETEAIELIHHAIACGITFIDTADAYCLDDTETGHNERLIGKALRQLPASQRGKIFVATKGGLVRPQRRWDRDGSARHLRAACDASLAALGVERIDLYQYHRIDPAVPLEESLGCLKELQQQGKIRFLGVSNFSIDALDAAKKMADIVSVQNEYSRRHRLPEMVPPGQPPRPEPDTIGTVAYTRTHGMAFLPWSPLNGIGQAKSLGTTDAAVAGVAAARGVSPQQVALAWLLAQGPQVIPIPGASRKSSVSDSVKAVDLQLTAAELASLAKI